MIHRYIAAYLDPQDVYSELLFGLIMALTFTLGASLIANPGDDHLRTIVVGTVACNIAWGVIDAVFYVLGEVFELGLRGMRIKQVRMARTEDEGLAHIRREFDERLGAVVLPEEREQVYRTIHRLIKRMEAPVERPTREGLIGAAIVFLLVSATSLPVLLPALLVENTVIAVQISNLLLIACLFGTGYGMARATGHRGFAFGGIMALIGLLLGGGAKLLGG